jgi:alpha-galactosidase
MTVTYLRVPGECGLLLDCGGSRLPRVLHWGADLGDLPAAATTALALASDAGPVPAGLDVPVVVSILPEQSAGWPGTPGLTGHRDGAHFSTAFSVTEVVVEGNAVTVRAEDPAARLGLRLDVEVTWSGLVRQRASVVNEGDDVWTLSGLLLALPVPAHATEVLDFTGRHLRERSPQRTPLAFGTHLRENRRGRTGFDAATVLVAGEPGFGFRSGSVWGLHVAWSGNHRTLIERQPIGVTVLGGGELLLSGEVRLPPGGSYGSPWLYWSHGDGLDEMSARFHRYLRSRPSHPALGSGSNATGVGGQGPPTPRTSPRPVTLNVWEAVYFDHRLDRLVALADVAAEVGVERFVLDDGWFRHRRNDRAGLGDWYVDEGVWPDGLHPLVDHVRGRGMQFGLWVEPEMVNLDSDLARAHPDWILSAGTRLPPPARHQQVLDIANPDAYAYLLERLDALLTEYDIGYLKWDHNRDLVEAGHSATTAAAVHEQTLAAYRLLAALKERHPGLEIESCSSGGGRIDLGILEHTDRVWVSDTNDALERQRIQRFTGLLLPPELLGTHVGPPQSHTTGRVHQLDFRAGTALFGHFGIEWDIHSAAPAERARLAEWVALYKDLRPLLHGGDVVRGDHPDPALWVHGVVAPDRSRAVYALVQVATSVHAPAGRVRLPGLDPDATYRVRPMEPAAAVEGGRGAPPWWADGVDLPGRVLGEVGVQAPTQFPERLVLVGAERLGALIEEYTAARLRRGAGAPRPRSHGTPR